MHVKPIKTLTLVKFCLTDRVCYYCLVAVISSQPFTSIIAQCKKCKMASGELDFTESQLLAFDRAVKTANTINEELPPTQKDLAVDLFGEFTDEQFACIDAVCIGINNPNQSTNEHEPQKIAPTAEQLELAMAIFDDDDSSEPSLEHLECLRSKFGHSQFREKQWDIINAIMNEKRDVSAVMATGYGKSLCFQVGKISFSDDLETIAAIH